MSLKHKIAYWRTKRGLTQRELAAKLGVSAAAVAHYETGQNRPRIEMLFKIAQVLDVDVNDLRDP